MTARTSDSTTPTADPRRVRALAPRLARALVAVWVIAAAAAPCVAQSSIGADPPGAEQKPDATASSPFANVQFSGLVQVWFVTGQAVTVDTFRVRRTELSLSGDVTTAAR